MNTGNNKEVNVKGKIDKKSGIYSIYGYALNTQSDKAIKCSVTIDKISYSVMCNLPKQHLSKLYKNINHGFRILVDNIFRDGKEHLVKLVDDETSTVLDETKFIFPKSDINYSTKLFNQEQDLINACRNDSDNQVYSKLLETYQDTTVKALLLKKKELLKKTDGKEYFSDLYHELTLAKLSIKKFKRNETPTISVIIPVFNSQDYLYDCLDSVVNQDIENIEIICVNDGSTDKSKEVLNSYASLDKRVVIIDQLNKGAGFARNAGLKIAKGQYVYFLDSDDMIDSDCFSKLLRSCKKYNSDICIFKRRDLNLSTLEFNSPKDTLNLSILSKNKVGSPFKASAIPNSVLQLCNIGVYTKLYKRDFLIRNKFEYLNTFYCNDIFFNHITLLNAQTISVVSEELMTYRCNRPNSLTQNRGKSVDNILNSYKELIAKLSKEQFTLYQRTIHDILYKQVKYELSLMNIPTLRAENEHKVDLFRNEYFKKFVGVKKYTYKSLNDLLSTIQKNIPTLPNDIDLVVGIPRSGMIPAYYLGILLNVKVCSLMEFTLGINNQVGIRNLNNREIKNVLIVDDSINTGAGLHKAKSLIPEELFNKYNIKFLVVYSTKSSSELVDYFFECTNTPRLFQWNYLNHPLCCNWCYDIDGVLCIDPTNEENDDGEKYKNFILNAKPLFIPNYKINTIVTSRLEKYRALTETWLKRNGVSYDKLIMLNLATAEERRKLKLHAKFKAEVCSTLNDCNLFVESEDSQAQEICKLSGKSCICVSTGKMYIK